MRSVGCYPLKAATHFPPTCKGVMWNKGDSIDVFQLIAERKIAEAIERGEFDHLPGKGKPLLFNDDPLESPHQRLANKILKNAGVVPIELSLRKELDELKRDYTCARTVEERRTLMREIRMMTLRINLMQKSPGRADVLDVEF